MDLTGSNKDGTFVAFIVFAVINSCYSVTWDVLMDWNLCKRNSKYPLLRNDLAYKDHVWVSPVHLYLSTQRLADIALAPSQFYYFALLTNLVGRFTWFIYLMPGQTVRLKGFIVALMETARRFQWNVRVAKLWLES